MFHLSNVLFALLNALQSAGPLFVAAADFQDQVDAGLSSSGIHAIKYMSVMMSIILAYKDGFSYHFSLGDEHMEGVFFLFPCFYYCVVLAFRVSKSFCCYPVQFTIYCMMWILYACSGHVVRLIGFRICSMVLFRK